MDSSSPFFLKNTIALSSADLLFLLVLLIFAVVGYWAGAIRFVLIVVKWILAVFTGLYVYRSLQGWAAAYVEGQEAWLASLISMGAVLVVFILASVIQHLILRSMGEKVLGSSLNRLAGIIPGLAAGLLVCVCCLYMLDLSGNSYYRNQVRDSRMYPALAPYSEAAAREIKPALYLLHHSVKTFPGDIVPEKKNYAGLSPRPDLESQMLVLLNQERKKRKLSPLVADEAMRKVGRAHARDMLIHDYFSHTSQDGRDPFDRMKKAKIDYRYAGENLASAGTLERAHNGLMNSPSHKAAILSGNFKRVGIAVIDGGSKGLMIAQEFRD